ncbi:DNA repair ATPase [Candidatus Endoriftia persephone str. Guaymas]|nr:DNA repair ATPase [Candidatus Endoriftia persephone str. Guaymas]
MLNTRLLPLLLLLLTGCSTLYYDTMEKVGYHKRDILADRVEATRDAQSEAQQQFRSALEQFAAVIELKNTDLKQAYAALNDEYEESQSAADTVSERIDKVKSVADALFDEWQEELGLYNNQSMKAASRKKLQQTRKRYASMLQSMLKAESAMQPVLNTFRDNVLFLKHNLNAQAIGTLRGEFSALKREIDQLLERMNRSIERSNRFIDSLQQG